MMKQALFAAILFAAVQTQARAQPAMPEHEPNLTNPQMQSTQQMQPPEAHQVEHGAGLGQANKIPTPVLQGQPMTNTDVTPGPARGPMGH
jgi:hypothetical protein